MRLMLTLYFSIGQSYSLTGLAVPLVAKRSADPRWLTGSTLGTRNGVK